LGWAAYGKLSSIFKSNIPTKLKKKAFNQCLLPVLIYASQFYIVAANNTMKNGKTDAWTDIEGHGEKRGSARKNRRVDSIEHISRTKWHHIDLHTLKDGRWTKKILVDGYLELTKRSRGKPPRRWTNDMKRISSN